MTQRIAIAVFCLVVLVFGVRPLLVRAATCQRWAKVPAPEFTLPSQEGTPVSLKDYRGKWVVLYFYPKDFTAAAPLRRTNFSVIRRSTFKRAS